MIGIVDYDAGNIASITNALTTIDARFLMSSDSIVLSRCDGIILPGVGAALAAMTSLQEHHLTEFLCTTRQPLLGICLGMQILYEYSEEGSTSCLGVFPGTIKKFNPSLLKIPHMGWNNVRFLSDNPLQLNLNKKEYFYFANSFYADIDTYTIATAEEGIPFSAVTIKNNYYGVQFHPEKSGKAGLRLLNNFVRLCSSSRQ